MVAFIDASETVEVEYVGDPDPMDEVTRYRIVSGDIPPDAAAIIRGASMMRSQVIPWVTARQCDPEHFAGLSRPYRFGSDPATYVQRMPKSDYEILRRSGLGHQFRLVGDPMNDLLLPRDGEDRITFVNDVEIPPDAVRTAMRNRAA